MQGASLYVSIVSESVPVGMRIKEVPAERAMLIASECKVKSPPIIFPNMVIAHLIVPSRLFPFTQNKLEFLPCGDDCRLESDAGAA